MDENTKVEYLKQFINNRGMFMAVSSVIEEVFREKSKDRDVNMLAANYLSLEKLAEAWVRMDKYKVNNIPEEKSIGQVGM